MKVKASKSRNFTEMSQFYRRCHGREIVNWVGPYPSPSVCMLYIIVSMILPVLHALYGYPVDLCMLAAELNAAFQPRPPAINGYCTLPRRPRHIAARHGSLGSASSQQWLSLKTAGRLFTPIFPPVLFSHA